jgi:hypothetical protein
MANIKDIAGWWEEGKAKEADFMIVVCDTFDHDDYPVFTNRANFWTEYDHYADKNMQRIMEVYDLSKSWASQQNGRVANTPPRLNSDQETPRPCGAASASLPGIAGTSTSDRGEKP